jgi:hypothetical protein
MVEQFLLQLYAEVAHACSRGSWTCFEQRGLPDRTPAGGYATPAQLIAPLNVKWMLIWVDPLTAAITLLKATPRAWLNSSETISVRRAPVASSMTRISFDVSSHLGTTGTVLATIVLNSNGNGGVDSIGAEGGAFGGRTAPASSAAISLSLRVPSGWKLVSVRIGGHVWSQFDSVKELVTLPKMDDGVAISVIASYSHV